MDRCKTCGREIGKMYGHLVHLHRGQYIYVPHYPISSRGNPTDLPSPSRSI